MTRRLRRLGFAGRPRWPLPFAWTVAGRIAVAARLLLGALRRALLLRLALLPRLTALPVATSVAAFVPASVALLAALGTFLGPATALVARRFSALRCRGGRDFLLARAVFNLGKAASPPAPETPKLGDKPSSGA